jgi:hypothetical protein
LLKLVIVKRFANVINIGVIGQFVTADYEHFLEEAVERFFVTVVTGVAGFVEQFAVKLEGGPEGFVLELNVFHELIIAWFGPEVKGVNRPERYG